MINNQMITVYSPFVDEFGNSVERTKYEYPYTYDGYIIWRGGENEEANNDVYTDRLSQWDYEKYNKLTKKHFKNESQYWNNREATDIEAFLRDYVGDQELKLIFVMEYCNQSTGYPVWRFAYSSKKQIKQ